MTRTAQDPPRRSRQERAAATRQRIVEAAYAAFVRDGYGATTMAVVAQRAEVAVQTVYFVFRTKGELLQAVYEHAVLGPHRTPPHLSPWWQAVRLEPDVDEAVRALVGGTLGILERAAPLVHVVLGDESARPGYEHNEGLRRAGNAELIRLLAEKQPLREGLDADTARDELLLLTSPQTYVQLAVDMRWPRERVAEWMTTSILQRLFGR